MAYLESEASKHSGKPVELFKFEGTYENFFYTSGPKRIRYPDNEDGDVYMPIAIRRSEINIGTQDDDGLDISVELSVKHRVVQVYGFQASPPRLELTVYRFHSLDEVVVYWQGPVNDIQVQDGIASIRSPSSMAAALARNVPGVYFQTPCNNVLYDPRCKVPFEDWNVDAEVTAIDGRVLTIDDIGHLGGKLIGGEVAMASGERRMITMQLGTEVIVNFPFTGLEVGDSVNLAAGCNLAYNGDCKLQFNNAKNFGGFPFIPAENPFEIGIDGANKPLPDNTCTEIPCQPFPVFVSFSPVEPMCRAYQPVANVYLPAGNHPGGGYQPSREMSPTAVANSVVINNNFGNMIAGAKNKKTFERDWFVNPESDYYQAPGWEWADGRLLIEYNWFGEVNVQQFGWNFTAYFPINSGGWGMQIQYPSGTCGGSVLPPGVDYGKFEIQGCRTGGTFPNCQCIIAMIYRADYEGLWPANHNWNW